MIPEMQFLDESNWLRSADWERVTDEELEGWVSAQRANGSRRFVSMTYKALKLYGEANNGRFPTDVTQLKRRGLGHNRKGTGEQTVGRAQCNWHVRNARHVSGRPVGPGEVDFFTIGPLFLDGVIGIS
jgi:hypothetical protein